MLAPGPRPGQAGLVMEKVKDSFDMKGSSRIMINEQKIHLAAVREYTGCEGVGHDAV